MAAPAFDAVTAIPSNDHAKLSSNQRDVGGSQANVSGWSPRKLAPVQHTTKMTRGEEPKDAVTGYRQASTMAAHLSPEEKHVGGRQESISGWSPKKMEEPGGNLASPPRLHDVVTQLSPEVHARHGGIYTGGRQENVSGWSRKYISHGRSDTMGNDTATGDSHLRTYHNSPPPGQDQYGADTVWGETAHGHSPGKRHFPDAEGPPAGDAFPREDMMASYGIQHQKRHIPEPPYDRAPAHPVVGASPPRAGEWQHDFGVAPKHGGETQVPAAASMQTSSDYAPPTEGEVLALARGEAFAYKPMF